MLRRHKPSQKEWAYAGVIFNLTGALTSHVASGYIEPVPMVYLVVLLGATVASWSLRPPSRATSQSASWSLSHDVLVHEISAS
jgi:hypothetical protein